MFLPQGRRAKLHRSRQRFSLLMLEERELYLEDYTVVVFPVQSSPASTRAEASLKGRLKLCSRSLIWDPEDMRHPVVRIPFAHVARFGQWHGTLVSRLPPGSQVAAIQATQVVQMKPNNEDKPYEFVKKSFELRFSLVYGSLDDFLTLLHRVVHVATKVNPSEAEQMYSDMLQQKKRTLTFDASWIVDLNETRIYECTCYHVTPLTINPGRLLLTNSRLYFQSLTTIQSEPVTKWELCFCERVEERRHMLRHTGLEIVFTSNQAQHQSQHQSPQSPSTTATATMSSSPSLGRRNTSDEHSRVSHLRHQRTHQYAHKSIFFTFESRYERDEIRSIILSQSAVSSSIRTLLDQPSVTQRWRCGQLSNFDYLMYVNSRAGRTFNDLTQYPVFPWIIADYDSPILDLHDANTFRDLSKPIGALNEERLAYFRERMSHMPANDPNCPPFLYGTHYSTPGYVLFYLVREAPAYMLRLQNGKFDAPDRCFHSIPDTWHSVTHNQTDVKELIPEFFCDSDFLTNTTGLHLGVKQNGERVGDVVLPAWASSADDFIRQHRKALESDYVSAHLHHWLDLIFGCKSTGKAAMEADNVFYHLTYEGAVDIEAITDPQQRAAIEAQIQEFGQTPHQLFVEPHPPRLPRSQWNSAAAAAPTATTSASFARVSGANASPFAEPANASPQPRAPLQLHQRREQRLQRADQLSVVSPATAALSAITSFEAIANETPLTDPVPAARASNASSATATLSDISSDGLLLAPESSRAAHLRSGSVEVCRLEDLNLDVGPLQVFNPAETMLWDTDTVKSFAHKSRFEVHRDRVNDAHLSKDGHTLYTVSKDSTLKVFDLQTEQQTRSFRVCNLPLSSCELTDDESSIIIGSWDNNVYFYSLDYGCVKDTIPAHSDAVSCLQLQGDTLITGSWDTTVRTWKCTDSGLNRVPTASFVELGEQVQCVALDLSGVNAAAGSSDDGSVMFMDLRSGRVVHRMELHLDGVTGMVFSPDGRYLYTCGADKQVIGVQLGTWSQTFSLHMEEPVHSIDTDGVHLMCAMQSGSQLKLLSATEGRVLDTFDTSSGDSGDGAACCLAVNGKSGVAVIGTEQGIVHHWYASRDGTL